MGTAFAPGRFAPLNRLLLGSLTLGAGAWRSILRASRIWPAARGCILIAPSILVAAAALPALSLAFLIYDPVAERGVTLLRQFAFVPPEAIDDSAAAFFNAKRMLVDRILV